jgi:hypothetical protein
MTANIRCLDIRLPRQTVTHFGEILRLGTQFDNMHETIVQILHISKDQFETESFFMMRY